ncbi:MAG: hypothetical protein ACREEM_33415 [Blastocatellia bacterium]
MLASKVVKTILCVMVMFYQPSLCQSKVGNTSMVPQRKGMSEAEQLCARLSKTKGWPAKNESVSDEIYNGLIKQGKAALPCLINRITATAMMRDPRPGPIHLDFRVGDAAFFLVHEITGVPLEQMLPDQIKRRWGKEGVYAYFKYVEKTVNRKALQNRWKAWLKENPSI